MHAIIGKTVCSAGRWKGDGDGTARVASCPYLSVGYGNAMCMFIDTPLNYDTHHRPKGCAWGNRSIKISVEEVGE